MIVDMMGGSIQLESEEGQGTRFTLKLRMKVVKPDLINSVSSHEHLKRTITCLSQTNSLGANIS
jgi:hypothetical protein